MRELGVEKIYVDKASGKDTARKQLQAMIMFIREGDTVIVESYSRLARSTRDLLNILEAFKEKGVDFISKKESIDTSTPAGRLMLTVFAGIYQFERECTLERQREGITIAKQAGKYTGRKPIKRDNFKSVYETWKAGGIKAVDAIETLNLSKPTFYRMVKKYESNL